MTPFAMAHLLDPILNATGEAPFWYACALYVLTAAFIIAIMYVCGCAYRLAHLTIDDIDAAEGQGEC